MMPVARVCCGLCVKATASRSSVCSTKGNGGLNHTCFRINLCKWVKNELSGVRMVTLLICGPYR